MASAVIEKVVAGSKAQKLGLEAQDQILAINEHILTDLIDYQYLASEEELILDVLKHQGGKMRLRVHKDPWEDLGLIFESATFDGIRRCGNRCCFCFVDQMPEGLRPSLYVKDDDYRYSFLYGNFITLTNIRPKDLERIINLRLSPLYISVHTTNPELRRQMMGNNRQIQAFHALKELAAANIELHTQVVLCPGLNDGEKLTSTVHDLASLGEAVKSIAVVPVGLTRHRGGLAALSAFDSQGAYAVVRQVKALQDQFLAERATRLVFAADEFYLLAGQSIPSWDEYEDFPQLENGIGMTRRFADQFQEAQNSSTTAPAEPLTVVTGVLAAPLMESLLDQARITLPGLQVSLKVLENHLFGSSVTVAGLIAGGDLLRLKGSVEGKLLIPENMLNAEHDLFLDNLTPREVARELKAVLEVVPVEGSYFLEALAGKGVGELYG